MQEENISKLLGTVLAQNDPNFLSYFVKRDEIMERLLNTSADFLIINAPRGSGKSGLLLAMEDELKRLGKKNVVIRKEPVDIEWPSTTLTIDQYVAFWKNIMLGWIVADIGKKIAFAVGDDAIAAVELATQKGDRQRSIPESLLSRLKWSSLPIEKVDFDPELNDGQALRIITDSNSTFWILVDEMDDDYNNSEYYSHRLVGLLRASRVVAQRFPNIRIRLTIRPHVMTLLKGMFEKVQTYWQNEIHLSWKREQLKEILARRIRAYDDPNSNHPVLELTSTGGNAASERSSIIARYFDDFDMSFKVGGCSDYRALATLSFGRPRWMIEFCHLALRHSESNRASLLAFQKAIYEYGNNRTTFIIGEHKQLYPEIDNIINYLAGRRRVFFGSTDEFRVFLARELVPQIFEGFAKRSKTDCDRKGLEVARLLYIVEIIRVKQDLGGKDDHRFLYFNDRPELLSSWPQAGKMEWHLHPTFAKALTIDDPHTFRKGPDSPEVGIFGEGKKKRDYDSLSWKRELEKLNALKLLDD